MSAIAGYPEPWGQIIGALIEREGGFVNHPNDYGRATCWGITLATLQDYAGPQCTAATVAALTREQAAAIYWQKWVTHPSCRYDLIQSTPAFLEVLFDSAVLFSRARANRWAQEAVNRQRPAKPLAVDGVLGPASRAALAGCDPDRLRLDIVAARIRRHAQRVAEDRSQAVFLRGWMERALSFLSDEELTTRGIV